MVKKGKLIGLMLLLLLIGLGASGGWLLATRSGALWLFERFGSQATVKVGLADLSGSLLHGLEMHGLKVDWPGGRLSVDQLQIDWQPAALLQRRVQIELLKAGRLELHLAGGEQDPPSQAAAAASSQIPDLQLLLSALGDWSLDLRRLEFDSLQLVDGHEQSRQLQQFGANIQASAAELKLAAVEFDGDWGRWRGALKLEADNAQLSGQLGWTPPASLGPLDALEVELVLARDSAGRLQGPVTFSGHGAESPDYRLAGDLQLDLVGLKLRGLQFDRGPNSGGVIRGDLLLDWQSAFSWQADLGLTSLDLQPEFGRATSLGGQVHLKGQQSRYAGHIELRNSAGDWEQLSLTGELEGDDERLALTQLQGHLLGGEVAGDIALDWRAGFSGIFKLQGHDLQLEKIPDGPKGLVDLQFDAWLKNTADSGLQLGGEALITKGVLLGRDFSGELRGAWQGGRQLRIDALDLSGDWGRLKAEGDLAQRLSFSLDLQDAKALWPPLAGQGELAGWLAWTADIPQGSLTVHLKKLAYQDWRLAELALTAERVATGEVDLRLNLTDVQQGEIQLSGLDLQLQGLPPAHQLQLQLHQGEAQVRVEAQGQWQASRWQGQVSALDVSAPAIESFRLAHPFDVSFTPVLGRVTELLLQGDRGGRFSLVGDWDRQADSRQTEVHWEQFNLAVLNPWLAGVEFAGLSQGEMSLSQNKKMGIRLDLLSDYVGALSFDGQLLHLEKGQISGHWDRQGLRLDAELLERAGGRLTVMAGSPSEVGFSPPQQGNFELVLKDLPLSLINRKMPPGQEVNGLLAVDLSGRWSADGHFALTGEGGIAQGVFRYHDGQSRLELPFEQTRLNFDWQPQGLGATFSLGLGEGDGLAGDLKLQLPARWPLVQAALAPIAGELQFHLGKLGALSLLVPEQLADFNGEIGGALRLAGSLQKPEFNGDLQLLNGRLSLSQLGIILEQIGLKAVFNAQKLSIEQIVFNSGEGQVKGTGEVLFSGWVPEKFKVELKGEAALIANLPELRAVASPELTLSGNAEGLTLGGRLKIPELQIVNWHPPGRVSRSADVVYVDQLPQPAAAKAFKLKLDLGVELGERVVVKDRGLDVRLKGKFHLTKDELSGVRARGQIDIPSGHYSAYGVKLPITSGRLYFNGGSADNPALDIVATKKIGEVSAGVAVGGSARQPAIRLISDPALDDTDILAYIVLGRPTLGSSSDFSALSLAAGAILSAGDSASLKQRLQSRSGIDVIDVNAGSAGGLEGAVVTIGKYLTPELYLSYGRALASSASQLQLRYSPSKRIDIESQLGEVSGADIYYKIEFTKIKF